MLRNVLSVLICLFISLSVNAQLNNGLLAHWSFSGNTNDVTSNGFNGTAANITYTNGKTGTANSAAKFNGTNSVVTIPYKSSMNMAHFSICAIVKFEDFYNGLCQHSMILQRGSFFQPGSYSLSIYDNVYDNGDCNKYDSTKMVFHQKVHNIESFVPNDSFKHSPNVKKREWYCVVVTYDSFRVRLYVDGQQLISYSSTRPIGTSTEGMSIGANTFNQSNIFPYWLNGELDDLRLYSRTLSPTEVKSYCNLFDTTVYISQQPPKSIYCSDDTFSVAYNIVGTFLSGNTFTAELSDATGNFSNPLFLGSSNSTTAGTILCNVPGNMPQGNNYRIRIRTTNPVRISDISQPISIHPNLTPSVTIAATPTGPYFPNQYITFKATPVDAGTAPTYQWYRNGNIITGATADSLYINTLNDGDSIHVVVYSSNKCPADLSAQSNKIGVAINTSVNTLQLENLALYPNPNSGSFRVTANNIKNDNIDITIINPLGQTVYKSTATKQNNNINHQIELNNVSAGMYLLKLSAEGKQRNIRLIVR